MTRPTLAVALLLAALLSACGAPTQDQVERPFQVTPAPATPDPNVFGGGQGNPYPDPASGSGGYPAPEGQSSGYPAPGTPAPETFGRTDAAIASLPLAEEVARTDFAESSTLIAVLPSRVMIANIGGPPVEPGWFYKFKTEGSEREYIVQVVDGVATGSVETQPIQPPNPAELPLPLDRITVDSDKVYELFAQRAPQLGVTLTDPRAFDLELIYLEGTAGPIWSVYNPEGFSWLMSVDATTGQEVPNPRG